MYDTLDCLGPFYIHGDDSPPMIHQGVAAPRAVKRVMLLSFGIRIMMATAGGIQTISFFV